MKRIAVCIITCNTGHLLRRCLQSVLVENPDEILVVDNGSRDGTVELLGQFFIGYQVTYLGSFIGFLYGFLFGFVIGYFISWLYNWMAGFRENQRK